MVDAGRSGSTGPLPRNAARQHPLCKQLSPCVLRPEASWALVAEALVVLGLWLAGLDFDPLAPLVVMTLAFLAGAFAFARAGRPSTDPSVAPSRERKAASLAARGALLLALAGSFACHAYLLPPLMFEPYPGNFRPLGIAAALTTATWLLPRVPFVVGRWRFEFLVLLFLLMGASILQASPHPSIDVWICQQRAAEGLLAGLNPYEMLYPNPYPPGTFIDKSLIVNGQISFYQYPPLTALLGAPIFWATGDVRWMGLVALGATALILRAGARSAISELATLLVLFQPGTFLVLLFGWTEPVVLVLFASFVLALRRWRRDPEGGGAVLTGLLAGLLLVSKQYAFLLLLPLIPLLPRNGLRRAIVAGACVASAIVLPFLAWNPSEFVKDVVLAQFLQPFRADGTSWIAALARASGPRVPSFVGLAIGLAIALGAAFRARSVRRAVLGSSVAFLALLLFHGQALFNYFWILSGTFALAVALSSAADSREQDGHDGCWHDSGKETAPRTSP